MTHPIDKALTEAPHFDHYDEAYLWVLDRWKGDRGDRDENVAQFAGELFRRQQRDPRPLYAHDMSIDALVAYVAWLLNNRDLATDPEFRKFCDEHRQQGFVTEETAKAWRERK